MDALPQERWIYCKTTVTAAVEETAATDGFRRRTKSGPYTGYIVEDFIKSGDTVSKLQPTGETLNFVSYWKGTAIVGSLILVRQDPNDGVYKVHGAECSSD